MSTKSPLLRKEEILSALVQARQDVLAEAAGLSAIQQDQVFLGVWSIKDLLAHLAGWDITNLEEVQSVLQGEAPSFYQHRDHDWQSYNALLVAKYKKNSFNGLLAEVRASHERLIAFLQTIAPEKFDRDFGVRVRGYKVTVQRLLEAEAKDEQTHRQQIARFFRAST